MENTQRSGPNAARLRLFELAGQIRQHKLMVLLVLMASIGAGAFYLVVATPLCVATTRLLVERQFLEKPSIQRHDPAFVATQAEIIRSRAVVERALSLFSPSNIASAVDPIDAIVRAIRVAPVEGTDVMQISYQGADGNEAVRMLDALTSSYREFLRASEQDSQVQTLTLLAQMEQELRGQLEEKQAQYRQLRESSPLLGVGHDAGKAHTDYLTNLGRALTQTKNARLQLENQLHAWKKPELVTDASDSPLRDEAIVTASFTEERPADPVPEPDSVHALPRTELVGQVTEIRAAEKQLAELQRWEKELDQVYGDNYPELRDVRSQIETVQGRLQEMLAAIPTVLDSELDTVRKNEQGLQQLYEHELQQAKQFDIQYIEEQQVVDGIERLRAVHDSILTQMHSRQLASTSAANGQGTIHVKVITPPNFSGKPVWPIPVVVLGLSGVVGLCAAFGLATGVERLSSLRCGAVGGINAQPAPEIQLGLNELPVSYVAPASLEDAMTERGP